MSLSMSALHAAKTTAVLPTATLLRLSLGGWAFFIFENTLLSHNRSYLISDIFGNNEEYYHYAYGTCSTIATGLIIHGYRAVRHAGPLTKLPLTPPFKLAAFTFQALGLVGLSQLLPAAQVPGEYKVPEKGGEKVWQVRCPFDFKTKDHDAVTGVGRVSRHSSLWSFASFGLGAALATASLPQAACLAAPVAVAAIGGAHQDYRFRRGFGGTLSEEIDHVTSNVPFAAMVMGKQGGVAAAFRGLVEESKGLNAGAALLVAAGLALRRGRR